MNAQPEPRRLVLRCQCGHCDLPYGYVQNGVLIIHSRHNGEPHINAIRLENIGQLLEAMQHNVECAIVSTSTP